MLKLDYITIRSYIKPGDVIAFSGRGFISALIKLVTNSDVSHVGVIKFTDETEHRVDIIESTTLSEDKKYGVHTRHFSDVIRNSKSDIAWLQLKKDVRDKFDQKSFFEYLERQEGRRYGYLQAIMAGLKIPTPELDLHQFCSELIAFAFQESGVLNPSVNASSTTPIALCRFPIYEPPVLVKGKPFRI